jgi:hypothetical protein
VEYFHLTFPRVAEGFDPFVYLSLEARGRLARGAPLGTSPGYTFDIEERYRAPERVIEITAVRILCAERVSPEWQAAWERLDRTLKEIVAETLTAPGEEKEKRLADLIEQGARDLDIMMHPTVDEEWFARVRAIDSRAEVKFPFQRRIAHAWGRPLTWCIERLGIEPGTGFTPIPDWDAAREILAESGSREEFVSGMKETFGEGALEQRIFHPFRVGEQIYAWQIAEASPEGYERTRAKARAISRDRLWRDGEEQRALRAMSVTLDKCGLVVRPLDRELLAEKMVLGGFVVEDVLPDGERWGLEKGDVAVTVKRVYDLVMEGRAGVWVGNSEKQYAESMRRLARGILNGKTTAVDEDAVIIRGDKIVAVGE